LRFAAEQTLRDILADILKGFVSLMRRRTPHGVSVVLKLPSLRISQADVKRRPTFFTKLFWTSTAVT
jgi:hypothetical protein